MDDATSQEEIAPLTGVAVAKALGCFWGAFVALNTIRAAVLGYSNPIAAFERRLVVASVGIILSWLIYRLLVRLRPASLRIGIALTSAMSLPAALVFATVNFLIFDMLTPMPGESCHAGTPCTMHDLVVSVSDMLINWAFVFVAWGALYLALASAAQTRAADLRSSADREAARLAQIRALRYQINPHFLFNVLNSLTALVSRRETAEAEALIGEIGSFLRYGLATDPVADATLGDEVEMQQRYLELERRRFPARLTIVTDIARAAAVVPVPQLLLQPLIENAIKHGVGRTSAPVTITISAAITADRLLEIVVADDAPTPLEGSPTTASTPNSFGIGLNNVRDRLAARFGHAARFAAGPSAAGGFRAKILIPLGDD
ncbi:histidine kinase [Sphingomonas antarctica]|uniref:sensor histidine kinase n=1 Tax=Sphingomonas antarctica TaxID=2040274 RepID=UPI0039E78FB2